MRFQNESRVEFSRPTVTQWYHRPGAFLRLAPPFDHLEAPLLAPGVSEGMISAFKIPAGPFRLTWKSIHEVEENGDFFDRMLAGPFYSWRHHHQFLEAGSATVLRDEVNWEGPILPVFTPFFKSMIHGTLKRNFRFRERRLKHDLARHQKFQNRPRLKIGITGASGVIGSALSPFLSTGGHEVFHFVRRKPRHPNEIEWDPRTGKIEVEKVRQLDAVIHLAGENVAKRRWSSSFKKTVLASRVQGTNLIAKTLAELKDRPRHLISASAIGIYSGGFLGEVCEAWEKALKIAEINSNLRVTVARIGVVLTSKGGALQELTLPTLLGAGGKIGNGRQPISWIALDDVLGAFLEILMNPEAREKVYDLVSPASIEQQTLSRSLAQVLHRPHLFRIPAWLIRLVFGQMGVEVLLSGQAVVPEGLKRLSFAYEFKDLEDLLRFELGRF